MSTENFRAKLQHDGIISDQGILVSQLMEVTPLEYKGRLVLLVNRREIEADVIHPIFGQDSYLQIIDLDSNVILSEFAANYSLASGYVENDTFYVYAAKKSTDDSGNIAWNDVTLFKSADLNSWEQKVVIHQNDNEQLFNSSVCKGDGKYIMAYESNDPQYHPGFSVKFAQSANLENWVKLEGAVYGQDRYTACPTIRFSDGFYYMTYLEQLSPRHWYETYMTRSQDLLHWEDSRHNPVLSPENEEEPNASDMDFIEYDNNLIIYFAGGDQLTTINLRRAVYKGTMKQFFNEFY